MEVVIPGQLAELLAGTPGIGEHEQAFPFLTVDEAGFPHVALLSRNELDVSPDRSEILVALYSAHTRANLARDGRAGLIAVGGPVAHYAKLRVGRTLELHGLLGCALELVDLKEDSYGIPLEPIGFHTSEEVARLDRWDLSASVLKALAAPADG
ncbi:MAG TPA: hypothetical protein VJ735_04275 [Actinomycetes bacterium]|nr:hypothetical protein [Actinomycetes bacterium]